MSELVDTPKKRVKVYVLENKEWKDTGTGFCQGIIEDYHDEETNCGNKKAFLLVKDEDSDDTILLKSRLEQNIEYQRQEETLIVWKDLNEQDIALSFEESVGCDTLCDFICAVQSKLEKSISLVAVRSNADGFGSVHEIISGPVNLPSNDSKQTEKSLLKALKILNKNTSFEYLRNETVNFILKQGYLSTLIKSFHESEDSHQYHNLLLLSNIVKTLILYNRREVIEQMINDENFICICGILEYDNEFANSKLNHRKYLEEKEPNFKEMIPISDPGIKLMITQNFRLQFLKDVVLVRFLDDHAFAFVTELMLSYQNSIINFLQQEGNNFIGQLMSLYSVEDGKSIGQEKRRDGIKLLHECVKLSQNLPPADKTNFYKFLIRKGLLKVVQFAFNMETDNDVRILATDIVVAIIEHDIQLIQSVHNEKTSLVNAQEPMEVSTDMSLLLILSKILLTDNSPGLLEQSFQALVTLLDPEDYMMEDLQNHDDSLEVLTFQQGLTSHDEDNVKGSEKFQLNDYLQRFYKQVAPILFQCFMDDSTSLENFDDQRLIKLVKLLNLMIQGHEVSLSRRFILEHGVLAKIVSLMTSDRILQLRLAALRCFKNVVFLNDDFYTRYIIGKNLFDSMFQMLTENLYKDNLANSTILDFFNILTNHLSTQGETDISDPKTTNERNYFLINKYLCGRYMKILLQINYTEFTKEMIELYDQEIPKTSTTTNLAEILIQDTPKIKSLNKRSFGDVLQDD